MRASAVLLLIELTVILASAALGASHPEYFARYFGPVPAPLVVVAVCALAFVAIRGLEQRTEFSIWRGGWAKGIGMAVLAALPFAAIVIIVDCFVFRFPRDINVPWPASLLFYPVMGFVIEAVFHLLPIAFADKVARLWNPPRHKPILWGGLAVAALLEPALQVLLELVRGPLSARAAFVGVQVLGFNVLELYLFRRFGFIPMYFARLVYYLAWHIIWGHMRLALLF